MSGLANLYCASLIQSHFTIITSWISTFFFRRYCKTSFFDRGHFQTSFLDHGYTKTDSSNAIPSYISAAVAIQWAFRFWGNVFVVPSDWVFPRQRSPGFP
jgi:hypothetical protein